MSWTTRRIPKILPREFMRGWILAQVRRRSVPQEHYIMANLGFALPELQLVIYRLLHHTAT